MPGEHAVAGFRDLCEEAGERGLMLTYEGDLPAQEVLELMEAVDSPNFGCYFDLANPLIEGRDPVMELRCLAGWIRSVHIKDFKEKMGDCRPGQGCVPLVECARVLREMDYAGWLILETPPAESEVVAGDVALARELFGG
ncbi:MAG: TIM barrel protein [Blastochloris sp.]|nr:TIM barrel protein [Blastochloris sp.]